MLGGMKMLGRVAARRLVAASNVTAGPADAKMKPFASGLEAFLTATRFRLHRLDCPGVLAFVHG
jgi:hypothetical protein